VFRALFACASRYVSRTQPEPYSLDEVVCGKFKLMEFSRESIRLFAPPVVMNRHGHVVPRG
jgi:hypothetical protein